MRELKKQYPDFQEITQTVEPKKVKYNCDRQQIAQMRRR